MDKRRIKNNRQKDHKTLTMHRALYPQAGVDRLYIPRNNGERGTIRVEDFVEIETEIRKKYVEKCNERLLKAVEGDGILGDGKTKKEILVKRRKNFMEKPLHS